MSAPVRLRAESFGAWVGVGDATLVAVDRALAARLGVDGGARWADAAPALVDATPRAPLEAHVAITRRCPAACTGCYLDAVPEGEHRPLDALTSTLDALADAGVFTVAFGGGEPLTHPGLPRLAAHARARGLVPVVTTSGLGLTAGKAAELADFAQVNVSLDGLGADYRGVRGYDGAAIAERAIATLVAAGVRVGINLVLTAANFDGVAATCRRAAELGAREVQLLRYKPAGRAASLDYLAARLRPAQVEALPALVRALVGEQTLSVRIDCALVPLLSSAFDDPTALVALGVMGCEAGRNLAAVTVDGAVAPCSFLGAEASAAVRVDDWDDAPALARWRQVSARAPEPCASCAIRSVCRGGCRVVADHLEGDALRPDPECPRVVAARAAG